MFQIFYRFRPEDMLAEAKWRTVSWRTGTNGKLKARFAAVRTRTAGGPPQRTKHKGQQHLPWDEAWLIGDHRADPFAGRIQLDTRVDFRFRIVRSSRHLGHSPAIRFLAMHMTDEPILDQERLVGRQS